MGMFDYVKAEHDCPKCGKTLTGWQSKDGPCLLETLTPDDVDSYYDICDCGEWVEYWRERGPNFRRFHRGIPLNSTESAHD